MDIRKIFKGLDKEEALKIINQCSLTFDEIPLAINVLVDKHPRLFICDEYGLSLGKYHYMLNRIITKIQSHLKLKLLGQ